MDDIRLEIHFALIRGRILFVVLIQNDAMLRSQFFVRESTKTLALDSLWSNNDLSVKTHILYFITLRSPIISKIWGRNEFMPGHLAHLFIMHTWALMSHTI